MAPVTLYQYLAVQGKRDLKGLRLGFEDKNSFSGRYQGQRFDVLYDRSGDFCELRFPQENPGKLRGNSSLVSAVSNHYRKVPNIRYVDPVSGELVVEWAIKGEDPRRNKLRKGFGGSFRFLEDSFGDMPLGVA